MIETKYPYRELSKLLALAYYRKYIIYEKRLDIKENTSVTVVSKNKRKGEKNA